LIGGGVLTATIPLLGNDAFSLLCVFGLALFGMAARRISTVLLGLLILNVLSNSTLTTFGAAIVFVVGDGVAALAGTAFGTTKLPWNDAKSVVGSASFLAGSSVALLGALYTSMPLGMVQLALLAILPSLAGCLAEALPFALVRDIRDGKPDDNLAVVLSSGAVLHLLIGSFRIGTTS
jgi:dolichol kinase